MILCKEAMNNDSACGKTCCCLYCEQRESCLDVCSELSQNCEEAIPENNKITVFENETAKVIAAIGGFALQKKRIEAQEAALRKQLQEAMERYGVKSFETPEVKFTYVAPTTRTAIDTTKLKKEMPEVATKYTKTSAVSASVKITVKE